MDDIIKLIPYLTASIAAFWALYLFNKQQKFKRLQNLSALWKEFRNDNALLEFFDKMDRIELGQLNLNELLDTENTIKLKYLALIEEVALYIENYEIDTEYAEYLFQWHFYYPYRSTVTREPFWRNLGGTEEMEKSYWAKSRELAAKIAPKEN